MFAVLKYTCLYVYVQLIMHETEKILYLGMCVDSMKQKNLVSSFVNVLVSPLLSPIHTYCSNKGVFFWLIIVFSIFL